MVDILNLHIITIHHLTLSEHTGLRLVLLSYLENVCNYGTVHSAGWGNLERITRRELHSESFHSDTSCADAVAGQDSEYQ